ncbi:MAG: hypothetical protein FWC97_02135 [Treponema sp.]|nr:hypothetical protein [Treponema sp.]
MNTNNKIQALAEELISLDLYKDSSHIQTIQHRIWLEMYSQIKDTNRMHNGSEVISIPLLGTSEIWTYDLWIQVLTECCGYNEKKNCWRYKSTLPDGRKAASFVTWFKHIMKWRIKNPTINIDSFDDYPIANEEKETAIGDQYAFDEYIENETTDSEKERADDRYIAIVSVLSENKKKVIHEGKKAQDRHMYFESFFTFDITKAIKDKKVEEIDVEKHNDTLFPLIQIILLEYLMCGLFKRMADICKNKLKSNNWLTRQQTIVECYEVTRQTVARYENGYEANGTKILGYDDFIKAIVY